MIYAVDSCAVDFAYCFAIKNFCIGKVFRFDCEVEFFDGIFNSCFFCGVSCVFDSAYFNALCL